MELQGTRIDLGDVEHRVHDLVQAPRTLGNTLEHRMDRGRQRLVFVQHFRIADDRGQGRSQFV